MRYFLFQELIDRHCLIPTTNHIEETMITPTNKPLRTSPNSYSFSRMAKNKGCSSKKIESPMATGVMAMDAIDKESVRAKVFFVSCIDSIKLSINRITFLDDIFSASSLLSAPKISF
jgi:hypothetical protein